MDDRGGYSGHSPNCVLLCRWMADVSPQAISATQLPPCDRKPQQPPQKAWKHGAWRAGNHYSSMKAHAPRKLWTRFSTMAAAAGPSAAAQTAVRSSPLSDMIKGQKQGRFPPESSWQARGLFRSFRYHGRPIPQAAPVRPAQKDGS